MGGWYLYKETKLFFHISVLSASCLGWCLINAMKRFEGWKLRWNFMWKSLQLKVGNCFCKLLLRYLTGLCCISDNGEKTDYTREIHIYQIMFDASQSSKTLGIKQAWKHETHRSITTGELWNKLVFTNSLFFTWIENIAKNLPVLQCWNCA